MSASLQKRAAGQSKILAILPSLVSRPFYDPAFTHTIVRGLLAATLGQVAVLSLITVTGILRGPQYPITSTSFWLHSPLHAAAVQSRRITRIYRCRRSWGRSHNAVLAARRSHAHLRRSFDQSSSASRFTAGASEFFI